MAMSPQPDTPTEPLATHTAQSTTVAVDSVWGTDNTLQVTDSLGDVWRFERSGPEGAWTEAVIYKNGVLQATLDYQWSGGILEGFRWRDVDSGWVDTQTDGDIIDTSAGMPSGGGCVDPEDPKCVTPDGWTVYSFGGGCEDEFHDMQVAAWEAAAGAGATLALLASPGGQIFEPPAIVGAGVLGVRAIVPRGILVRVQVLLSKKET